MPRAMPSGARPALACPTPGNVSDHEEGVARGDGRGRPFLPQKCTEGGTADAAEVEGEVVLRPARRARPRELRRCLVLPLRLVVRSFPWACDHGHGGRSRLRGRGSERGWKHCPHHSASALTSALQFGQRWILHGARYRRCRARLGGAPSPREDDRSRQAALASRSHPARRSATRAQVCSRSTRARPAFPAVGRTRGPPTASRRRPPPRPPPPRRRAARSLRGRGLPGPAGVADDHRTTHAAASMKTFPQPLHLESGEAGPARHREDVSDGVVPGQVLFGHLAHERDRARRRVLRERPEGRLEGPGADDQQPRLRHPSLDRAHRSDQDVLPLPRDEPAHADDQRAVAEPVPFPDVGGGQVRAEPLDIGARMEHRDRHVLRHGGPYPAGDELATPGHPRRGRRHPLHDGMGDRHRREPVVETVREDDGGRAPIG